ncbi:hypothetical protein Nepgr_003637 [Nepenthes gracilis]|uniref:SBP-type domain-containing protein n=1 Tax=Nepenthes gracilis TaxID=150966 RepID=A0AAD3XDX4_NEPGR|nr:hypothetical protein Nepgr_003637 [Nepenthes gracilis]
MESWKFSLEGKDLLMSEDINLTVDGIGRSRNKVMGWGIKPFSHPETYRVISNTEALDSFDVMELGFADMIRKPYFSDPSGDGLCDEIGADSYENLGPPTCSTSNAVCGEKESGLRNSGHFMESNIQNSPLVDLQLGWFADCTGAKDSQVLKEYKAVPSIVSSSQSKKARLTNLYSQPPYCQVYGCNKDLSSSKEYHKRHKVCDTHSKTARVIVNGIEQRFCQQCSRFHLLAEFDDGKRSCRKRLANHNERRRKPQLATRSGTKFLDPSSIKRASFLFPSMMPGSILSPGKHEAGKWINSVHNVAEKTVGASLGARDNMVGLAASGIQYVSTAPDYCCALSLLSSQSQNMPRDNMLRTTISGPRTAKISNADYNSGQSTGCSPGSLEKLSSTVLHSPEMRLTEVDEVRSTQMISCDGRVVNIMVPESGVLTASDFLGPKCCTSSGHDTMVDLLQLSAYLQRVEQQRSSMLPPPEDDVFCTHWHSHGE